MEKDYHMPLQTELGKEVTNEITKHFQKKLNPTSNFKDSIINYS